MVEVIIDTGEAYPFLTLHKFKQNPKWKHAVFSIPDELYQELQEMEDAADKLQDKLREIQQLQSERK